MNQPLFLHIVERLEGFLHKLPASIQKPILHELTPLKQLFLQQRAPRFILTGSHKLPVQEVVATLFAAADPGDLTNVLMEVFRWHNVNVGGRGTIEILDARGADEAALRKIEEELARVPGDMFLHLVDGNSARPVLTRDTETLRKLKANNASASGSAKIVGVSVIGPTRSTASDVATERASAQTKLQAAFADTPELRDDVLQVTELPIAHASSSAHQASAAATRLMALLAENLPNEARVEMIRISGDRKGQTEIAQVLVKSTSAICTAIGAQPIPLADLPILTTLQLVMVSGIMYIAGRERSLRASTEFVGALGVNVGAGMVFREGARAVLKFFPGWGNVVCGMIAGAGTYALGRAAIVYFLEGVSLKDARRIYVTNGKKAVAPKLLRPRMTREPASDAS
jgi:uncharacterized protein (DUF697 family)